MTYLTLLIIKIYCHLQYAYAEHVHQPEYDVDLLVLLRFLVLDSAY